MVYQGKPVMRPRPATDHNTNDVLRLVRLYSTTRPEDESMSAVLLDRLVAVSETMARHKAAGPADVLAKICVWRVVASEDARSYDTASPDEALALSIMDDCERLWGPR